MRKFVMVAAVAGSLAGCAGQGQVVVPDHLAACGSALLAGGVASPELLLPIALANADCRALAADVLQQLIATVSKQQFQRGLRR
jgi:hypothetical protein